ncbi:hypothetical protein [Mycobacterium riyadhense]|nr:hypothetical protein [Mycobacterium riyadhense]MCV7145550.1 hypothetical protein [Mycobacterium riyadhense]VTP00760.1 hypothetical protein BIN_B_03710 [Mycobacterium riyadhense]
MFMMALAVIAALLMALFLGYHFGRRAGSTPAMRKRRRRRAALGGLALSLIVLMVARRIQQGFVVKRALPGAAGGWGLKLIEALQLRRGRRRFHRPMTRWAQVTRA